MLIQRLDHLHAQGKWAYALLGKVLHVYIVVLRTGIKSFHIVGVAEPTIDYQPTDRVAKRGLVVGVGPVHVELPKGDKGRCGNLGQKWIDVQLVLVQLRLHVCTLMHGHGGKQPSAVTPLWTKTIACLGLLASDCMPHGENNE